MCTKINQGITCHLTEDIFWEDRDGFEEKNDCVVRALASVFEVEYEAAHMFAKKVLNRKHRKGTYTYTEVDGHDFVTKTMIPRTYTKRAGRWCRHCKQIRCNDLPQTTMKGYYTKKFIKDNPKGAFLVLSKGHGYAIIDGEIWGNNNDFRKYIHCAYEITDRSVLKEWFKRQTV